MRVLFISISLSALCREHMAPSPDPHLLMLLVRNLLHHIELDQQGVPASHSINSIPAPTIQLVANLTMDTLWHSRSYPGPHLPNIAANPSPFLPQPDWEEPHPNQLEAQQLQLPNANLQHLLLSHPHDHSPQ